MPAFQLHVNNDTSSGYRNAGAHNRAENVIVFQFHGAIVYEEMKL